MPTYFLRISHGRKLPKVKTITSTANSRCVVVSFFYILRPYQCYIAAPWSVTSQVSNKLLYLLGIAITPHWVVPDIATKTVWPEYFFGPGYDEDCVENQADDESAPLCPPGFGYGAGSGNTFAYKLPGSTAPCGSERPPLIHLIPGKIYKLILINNTKSPTNLHTHGLHIDGNGYSDDVFRQVDPGMCLEYIWAIDEVCSCGTYVSLCFRWGCKSNLTSFFSLLWFFALYCTGYHSITWLESIGTTHIIITIHLKQ